MKKHSLPKVPSFYQLFMVGPASHGGRRQHKYVSDRDKGQARTWHNTVLPARGSKQILRAWKVSRVLWGSKLDWVST